MRTRVLLLFFAVGAGCQKGPAAMPTASVAASPVAAMDTSFWQWFASHKDAIVSVKRGDEPIAEELAEQLHRIDPQLTFELGVAKAEHELIVSADGIKSSFPTVKRLVAAAPAIPGWTIVAFRQRKPTTLAIELGNGTRIASDAISFRVLGVAGGKLELVLYVNGLGELTTAVKQAILLQLDAAVGEYDVETYIGGIDVQPASATSEGTRPFRELPSVVDGLK